MDGRKGGQHNSSGDGRKGGRKGGQAKQLRRLQSPHHCPQSLPRFLAASGREGSSCAPTSGWVLGGQKG